MEARVISVVIGVYRTDEAIKVYEEGVAPAVKLREGGIGSLLLGNRETGRGLSITFWESKEKEREAQESGFMKEQLARFAAMIIGEPQIETLEVLAQDM